MQNKSALEISRFSFPSASQTASERIISMHYKKKNNNKNKEVLDHHQCENFSGVIIN
jgi:hypothetical protein